MFVCCARDLVFLLRYYFDDTWVYYEQKGLWEQHQYPADSAQRRPKARKGHTIVVRKRLTNGNAQVILFGGQQQDVPLDDLWIYAVEKEKSARMWTRLDHTYVGIRPEARAFHTSVWISELNAM